MAQECMWLWDDTNKLWVKAQCDPDGKLIISDVDPFTVQQTTPMNLRHVPHGYYAAGTSYLPYAVDSAGKLQLAIAALQHLSDIADVNLTGLTTGDFIYWDAVTSKWERIAHKDATTGVHGVGTGTVAKTADILLRNIIINGGFTINQRVYVSAATLAAGVYGHDRWKGGAGGGTYSFTQLASPTTITIAANKTLIQVIEDKNVYGGTYILSWTGTCQARYAINSATPAGAYADSPITITGQTAGTTMSVEFGKGAASGTLGEVQLELGSVVTPFEFRPFGQELGLCYRYCEKLVDDSGGADGNFIQGVATATTTAIMNWQFKVQKRTIPTFTFSGQDHFETVRANWANVDASTAMAESGANMTTTHMGSIRITTANLVVNDVAFVRAGSTVGVWMLATAEL